MRKSKNENYEQWVKNAQEYEKDLAEHKLKQGQDPNIVLEEFAQRLINKLLYPVYQELREKHKLNIDHSQKLYEELYLNKRKPVADQVDGNLFDYSREK